MRLVSHGTEVHFWPAPPPSLCYTTIQGKKLYKRFSLEMTRRWNSLCTRTMSGTHWVCLVSLENCVLLTTTSTYLKGLFIVQKSICLWQPIFWDQKFPSTCLSICACATFLDIWDHFAVVYITIIKQQTLFLLHNFWAKQNVCDVLKQSVQNEKARVLTRWRN